MSVWTPMHRHLSTVPAAKKAANKKPHVPSARLKVEAWVAENGKPATAKQLSEGAGISMTNASLYFEEFR